AEPRESGAIEPIKPAKRAAVRCDQLISLGFITIDIRHISVACSAGSDDLWRVLPGVPLRSTPGFILPPAFAGWYFNHHRYLCRKARVRSSRGELKITSGEPLSINSPSASTRILSATSRANIIS